MKFNFFKKFFIVLQLILLFCLSLSFPTYSAEPPEIECPAALLMDLSTGKILYEKNINEKMYPASLTKVLTAIVVLENCDLNELATVSYEAVMTLSSGYVTANLQLGEQLTVEQLLYVLMVGSSNDAAIVLAEHLSGSVEEFSKLMNEKAKEIGCSNSNFVNPNGVHNENHYSTAYDLAILGKYAMQNEMFRKLVSTTSYQLPATEKYEKNDRLFTTTNNLLIINNNNRSDNYYYKYATGIKTGFTTPAGNCLISSSNKNGFELLCVVLKGGQNEEGLSQRFLNTISLFEYGYENYFLREVSKSNSVVQTVTIKNATKETKKLDVVLEKDINVLIKSENKNDTLLPEIKIRENLKAPIAKGEIIGKIVYTVEDITYESNLLAAADVKPNKIFLKILFVLILIFVFYIYKRINYISKRNRRLKIKKRVR